MAKIHALLVKFPLAAAEADSELDYPLHIIVACDGAEDVSLDIIRVVYEAYPAAAAMKNSSAKYPLHWAASLSNGAVVEFLYRCYPPAAAEADYKSRYPLYLQ